MGQKQGYFKLPPFCFFTENDFESDFEIESENEFKFKIGFESDFESDFESENVLCFTWNMKMNSQKAHLWAENYTTAIQFCQELFQKIIWRTCRPSPKKKTA